MLSKWSNSKERLAKILRTCLVRPLKNLRRNCWKCCTLLASNSLCIIRAIKDQQPWICKATRRQITCSQELWTLNSSNCWGGEVEIRRKALNTLFRNTKFVWMNLETNCQIKSLLALLRSYLQASITRPMKKWMSSLMKINKWITSII